VWLLAMVSLRSPAQGMVGRRGANGGGNRRSVPMWDGGGNRRGRGGGSEIRYSRHQRGIKYYGAGLEICSAHLLKKQGDRGLTRPWNVPDRRYIIYYHCMYITIYHPIKITD
jgi:hypothetical protein